MREGGVFQGGNRRHADDAAKSCTNSFVTSRAFSRGASCPALAAAIEMEKMQENSRLVCERRDRREMPKKSKIPNKKAGEGNARHES